MNLISRVEKLERATGGASNAADDARWRETLNHIGKVYGDGSPVVGAVAAPSREVLHGMIAAAYANAPS